MKVKTNHLFIMLLCTGAVLSACNGGGDGEAASKPNATTTPTTANGDIQQNGVNSAFSGKLFYEFSGQFTTLDLASGTVRPYLPQTTDRLSFAISSDGRTSLVSEQVTGGNGFNNGSHRYLSVSTETGQTQSTLPGSAGTAQGMAIKLSPSGQYIATGLFRYEWGQSHLVVEDRSGNLVFDFTAAGYDFSFGWLPDDSMVAADANGWLTLFDRNFNPMRRIRQFAGPELPGRVQASPDGQRLVFSWNQRIYVMNIDGSNLRQVATSDLWESGVAWSPDSRWLVLAHGEASCPQLMIVNADESMVDVSYATRDPRAHQVQAASDNKGKLEPVCGNSLSWR